MYCGREGDIAEASRVVKVKSTDYGKCAMKVILNGEEHECKAESTLVDLVAAVGVTKKRIAIEVNREIIPREQYASYHVQAGDHIEIVQFVGGG